MAMSPAYQARELGEALGNVRAALSAARSARQGYVARHAIQPLGLGDGQTADVSNKLSTAIHTLNDAERALIDLFQEIG